MLNAIRDCAIVSGGPSVGKTTLTRALRREGLPVIIEAGTSVIEEGVYHPAKDRHSFQMAVLERQLQLETKRKRGRVNWCDRGLLDGPAYYLNDGMPVPAEFDHVDVSHYLVCFLLEPLATFERDGIRPQFEDLEFTRRITPLLEQCYLQRGIQVVRVPDMPVVDRIAFIQAECSRLLRLAP
jgi:predicted ATPase